MATKKINKVETPIDRRETFVSIRKTFADSDLSVEEKLKTLYSLQKADSEIDKILQLRGELPDEVESLEKEVEEMKAKVSSISESIEGFTKAIADNKENILDCDAEIAKYRKQIENITNSREYDSLDKEIENQGYLRQIAEKNINEAKVRIAELKSEAQAVNEDIAVRSEDLKVKKEELDSIVESTAKEEKRLRAARKSCAEKIDARTMSAYDRIRESVHNHLAVVTVYNGNSCGGCFNTIIPQRIVDINSNKKLVICEHCRRIIVSSDLDKE